MKYNEKELIDVSTEKPKIEDILSYLKPCESSWCLNQNFKKYKFKLIYNLLYYFQCNDEVPYGVIILENCEIVKEEPQKSALFGFSIRFTDDPQSKHLFSCRYEENVDLWVKYLKNASYENWKKKFNILRRKIWTLTGQCPKNELINFEFLLTKKKDENSWLKQKIDYQNSLLNSPGFFLTKINNSKNNNSDSNNVVKAEDIPDLIEL